MPPGDPILKVRAPKDALQVTAYFPFGLVQDLEWDENTEHWSVRFLVPKGVVDGEYDVRVVIRQADGKVEMATIPYLIDSTGPEFEVKTTQTATGVQVVVTAAEESRLVTVALASDPSIRVELTDSGDKLTFSGVLELPPGEHELRVVVADCARNEADSLMKLELK
jgi:Ca-activated chloride channel family protein